MYSNMYILVGCCATLSLLTNYWWILQENFELAIALPMLCMC